MTQTMTVSEARANLPEVLDRVERGEEITITRHGRAVAVVLGPALLRHRRSEQAFARAREIREMLEAARRLPLAEGVMSEERAEELVRAIRADRDDE